MLEPIKYASVGKLIPEALTSAQLVNTKTEGGYRVEFEKITQGFSELRNNDKMKHFNALDKIINNVMNEKAPDMSAFNDSLCAIHDFEVKAKEYVVEYEKVFIEFERNCCHGDEFIDNIPFLNGKKYPVNTPDDRNDIKKLIDVEGQNKSIQIEIFGQIPVEVMKEQGVSDKDKLIIIRAVQRFLNALTLTLNSPLGDAAINNVKELSKLIGCPEPESISVNKWNVDSVRTKLLPQLESVITFIYDASLSNALPPCTLSKNGMEMLENKCMEISNFVDQYNVFNVPDIFKNKSV